MTAPEPQISRQRAWQLKKQAAGLCIQCGGERAGSKLRRCFKCADRNAALQAMYAAKKKRKRKK